MRLERDNIPLDKDFPFQISEVVLTPKNSRPGTWHWHSYFEITCVIDGKGNYFVNGQEYTMEKDDVIIFNNVEPHGWNLIGDDMKLLVMIFSPEFIAEKISVFDTEYLKPFVERGSNFKNRVGREDEINADIRAGIWEIYKEWNDQKEGYPLMIKANVLRILTMLIRTYQDETKSGEMLKEKKNAMKRLEQAFDYIDAHYCEKITLQDLRLYVERPSPGETREDHTGRGCVICVYECQLFFILFSQGDKYQFQRLCDTNAYQSCT